MLFFKRLILPLILLAYLQPLHAQRTQPETLFGGTVETNSGYGGPCLKYTRINGEPALFFGGYGGWFINNAVLLGIGGQGLSTDVLVPEDDRYYPGSEMTYEMGYGGLVLEFTIKSKSLVHISFGSLIGGGGIEQRVKNNYTITESSADGGAYFVTEPFMNLELNITRFFRLSAGAGYRYTAGSYSTGIEPDDINTWSGNLTFKFGWF